MTTPFKLDDIRAAAHAKYADTTIVIGDEEVTLLNPLRLPKEKREKLTKMTDRFKDEGADQFDVFCEVITAAAKDTYSGKALIKALNGDLTVAVMVFETYMKAVEAGEA